jgi:PII-like signaling protein
MAPLFFGGQVGFGHSTRIHTTKIPVLSQDLPLVVEIVDSQEKIDQFLPVLDTMMTSGLLKYSPQALRRRA